MKVKSFFWLFALLMVVGEFSFAFAEQSEELADLIEEGNIPEFDDKEVYFTEEEPNNDGYEELPENSNYVSDGTSQDAKDDVEKMSPWGSRRGSWGGRRSSWGSRRRASLGSRRRASWGSRRRARLGSRRRSGWRSSRRRSFRSSRRRSSWRSTRRRRSSLRSTRRRRSSWRSTRRRRSSWRSTRRRRSSWRSTRRRTTSRRRRTFFRRRRTISRRRRFLQRRRSSSRRRSFMQRRRSSFRRRGLMQRRRNRRFWRRTRSTVGRRKRVTKKVGGWLSRTWRRITGALGKARFRIRSALGGGGSGGGGTGGGGSGGQTGGGGTGGGGTGGGGQTGGGGTGGGGSGGQTGGGSSQPTCDRKCKMEIRKLLNFVKILEQSYCAFYGAKHNQSDYLKFRDADNATTVFDRYISDSLKLHTQEINQIKTIDSTMQFKTKAQLNSDCIAPNSTLLPCKNATIGIIKAFQALKCTGSCKGSDYGECQASDARLTNALEKAIKAYNAKVEAKAQ